MTNYESEAIKSDNFCLQNISNPICKHSYNNSKFRD